MLTRDRPIVTWLVISAATVSHFWFRCGKSYNLVRPSWHYWHEHCWASQYPRPWIRDASTVLIFVTPRHPWIVCISHSNRHYAARWSTTLIIMVIMCSPTSMNDFRLITLFLHHFFFILFIHFFFPHCNSFIIIIVMICIWISQLALLYDGSFA